MQSVFDFTVHLEMYVVDADGMSEVYTILQPSEIENYVELLDNKVCLIVLRYHRKWKSDDVLLLVEPLITRIPHSCQFWVAGDHRLSLMHIPHNAANSFRSLVRKLKAHPGYHEPLMGILGFKPMGIIRMVGNAFGKTVNTRLHFVDTLEEAISEAEKGVKDR